MEAGQDRPAEKNPLAMEVRREETNTSAGGSERPIELAPNGAVDGVAPVVYRTYKRRWFGLIQLILLNIVVSWDVGLAIIPGQCCCNHADMPSGSPTPPSRTRRRPSSRRRPPSSTGLRRHFSSPLPFPRLRPITRSTGTGPGSPSSLLRCCFCWATGFATRARAHRLPRMPA
jgi:hypothetical protein